MNLNYLMFWIDPHVKVYSNFLGSTLALQFYELLPLNVHFQTIVLTCSATFDLVYISEIARDRVCQVCRRRRASPPCSSLA
uniref:Uncharacterized protein n=1 Tax=Solanum lycopersicum TaxID=4081 RepID=K4AUL0_SOLLC